VRRNRALGTLLVFALGLFALLPSGARAADGYALLKQAVSADDHVTFSGTITSLVYGHDATTATIVRVEHRAPNEWRMWYVAPADAYGRLIVSNESVQYQYEPKTGKVFSNDWVSPLASAIDVVRIRHNYSVQLAEQATIAGRPARTLSLVSNYSHTLAQRLWIDSATNLVLRREIYHADSTLAAKTEFDNITFVKDLPPDLFKMSVPAGMTLVTGAEYGTSTPDLAALTSQLKFKAVTPHELADGFAFQKGSIEMRGGVQSAEFVYSDGLRSVSLFENPTGDFPTFDGPAAKPIQVGKANGKYQALTGQTLVSWNANGLNLTMVGDIAPKELARIASLIKM
jgi:outer membrane lipoprotein-sorting protein